MEKITITIPQEYNDEFIEAASAINLTDTQTLLHAVRQSLRSKISAYASTRKPDENEKQTLECRFTINNKSRLHTIETIYQYQGGEMDIVIDGKNHDFDDMDTDILFLIAEFIETYF